VSGGDRLELGRLASHDYPRMLGDQLDWPSPPSRSKQPGNVLLVEAPAHNPRRVPSHDRVRVDIGRDNASRRHDSAVTDRHAREHERLVAEPNVVPDYRVAPARCAHYQVHRPFRPRRAEDAKQKGRRPQIGMVRSREQEAHARRNLQ
jgi:hypothetical protein